MFWYKSEVNTLPGYLKSIDSWKHVFKKNILQAFWLVKLASQHFRENLKINESSTKEERLDGLSMPTSDVPKEKRFSVFDR